MKPLTELTADLRKLIDQNFSFKLTQAESLEIIGEWIDNTMHTDNGNRRYPRYYQTSLNVFRHEYMNVRMNELTLFCYDYNGVLYTTYNRNKPASYMFKGVTDIQNYKDAGISDNELWNCDSGFYYNCGKPYFVMLKV